MKSHIPKPKTTFQAQLNFLQTINKHPFRSKTPPLQNNSKIYVNTTVNYDDESDEIEKNCELFQENKLLNQKNKHVECNSNSSRRITAQKNNIHPNKLKKDNVLRFSLENNKNLAWNDIAKLLNNTNKKEITQPKCLKNDNKTTNFQQQMLNKCHLLRKSLNQKADNMEAIPVIHENFENLVNNYMNNQKNNIRHSYEGLPIEKKNQTIEENIKIQNMKGFF